MPDREFIVPGNPVPYLRMTQGQLKMLKIPDYRLSHKQLLVKRKIQRYAKWKSWVHAHIPKELISGEFAYLLVGTVKTFLHVHAFFENLRHGDPDNIRKGIQDAIYYNDKLVGGCVDFDYDRQNPRCIVKVSWSEK
jgi:hypothetical protein